MSAAQRTSVVLPLHGHFFRSSNPNGTPNNYRNDTDAINLLPFDSDHQALQTSPYADRGSGSSSSQRMRLAAAGVEERPPWQSGVIARLPYAGLASMFGIVLREF
jgi:hypothetical protein